MANKNELPVTLADDMTKGIQDAMVRIQEMALDKCDTLADNLAVKGWGGWDMSNESPNVIDPDGISGTEDDGVFTQNVA